MLLGENSEKMLQLGCHRDMTSYFIVGAKYISSVNGAVDSEVNIWTNGRGKHEQNSRKI